MRKYGLGLWLLPLLVGCIEVPTPPPLPAYSVYSVISPTDPQIKVFVAHAYTREEVFPIDSLKYVANAKVVLYSPTDSLLLQLNKRTKNYEAVAKGFVHSNQTYRLQVITPTGTVLKATTYVPEQPTLEILTAKTENLLGSLQVAWKVSADKSTFYRLLGSVDFNTPLTTPFYWGNDIGIYRTNAQMATKGQITAPLGSFYYKKDDKKAIVTLRLEATDKHWGDFANKLDLVIMRNELTKKFESPLFFDSNITNGLGVFGSKTVVITEITLPVNN